VGSLQNENGANVSRRNGADIFDGTNSRWRLGVAPCFEVLIDLPSYVSAFRGVGASGFGDVVPAVKWQTSPVPGKLVLAMTVGPDCQAERSPSQVPSCSPFAVPVSVELGDSLTFTGMVTNFFSPENLVNRFSNETTFVIEKSLGERSFVFVEYVGEFSLNGGVAYLINSGGGYRITNNQQIDFHIAIGLNHNSPNYIFGVGYSFRLDGLFKSGR
jgi:hypothetical protein